MLNLARIINEALDYALLGHYTALSLRNANRTCATASTRDESEKSTFHIAEISIYYDEVVWIVPDRSAPD